MSDPTSDSNLNKAEAPNLQALLDLFHHANVLFCVAEPDGRFSMLNPYWSELLGWSLDELYARPFIDFVHPDDIEQTIATAESQFVDKLSVASFCNRYRTKDGDYRWLEWTARSPEGDTVYAVAHDVTEEKKQEEKLAVVQARLQDLIQNVPGAFFQYVVKLDGTHTMQYMSPGSKAIWGLTPEEIGDDPACLWQMILSEDVGSVQESVQQSLEHQTEWNHEYRIQLPNGEIRWLRGVGTPRLLESGDTFWNSLVMDLTEVREQQNTIAKMQRMDMIGHLAAGISHDFNNILAIIEGHRQLLALKTNDPDLVKHIELMESGIHRAEQLTKRLLLSSKKRMEPSTNKIPIASALEDIRTLLDEITPSNINVRWNINNECETQIEATEFEDVVTNIFINAKNALNDNGVVRITLSREDKFRPSHESYIHMKPARAGGYSVLSIADNGCGIDSSRFEKIFIPFITSSESGTGLGLAMVVGFASRNDYGITLSSKIGEGTELSLWIPEQDSEVEPFKTISDSHVRTSIETYHIVLIDDEQDVLDVVTEMLKFKGHTVTSFIKPDKAQEWLDNHLDEVDILLTDEIMPGPTQGHNLYEQYNNKLPVLIMTGYLDSDQLDLNAVTVLQKPIVLQNLLNSIDSLMSIRKESMDAS